MTEHFFDHDRLDVYRLSIEYVATAFDSSRPLEGLHLHDRDQSLHAAQSIPLNIAEGTGKRSLKNRARFLGIASGLESTSEHNTSSDYEHEHREAEHEHDEEPEPSESG